MADNVKSCTCNDPPYDIQPVLEDCFDVATRITWDGENNALYFVDVPNSKVFRYNTEKEELKSVQLGDEPLAFVFPVAGTTTDFVVGMGRKVAMVTWKGAADDDGTCKCTDDPDAAEEPPTIDVVAEVDGDLGKTENRLNGGKVDSSGRLWAGTMGPEDKAEEKLGSLYSVSGKSVRKHMCSIGISNGIAFSQCGCWMYYIDSSFNGIYKFKFDEKEGDIANREVIFEFEKNEIPGSPDGMTIDSEGKLWIACIYGSKVIQIDPNTGEVLNNIDLPTSQPTSLCFGGPDLDILYVCRFTLLRFLCLFF